MNRHSKAVRTASIEGGSSRRAISLALVSLAALLTLVFAASASALSQRPFKGAFGSVEQPSFGAASGVAVDQASGDVLIADGSGNTIRRFHADGTPAPFAALGSNTIDGAEASGKPCAEEPASCDKTPQNGIQVPAGSREQFQIAIDESGGPTDGDIYLTQFGGAGFVDIFAEDGRYLGQLTEAGVHAWQGGVFSAPRGVAVDSSGAVYVSNGREQISKFVPTANPVVNTDLAVNFLLPARGRGQNGEPTDRGFPFSLALGAGPTTGSLFVAAQVGECIGSACGGRASILQLDKETGEEISEFDIDPPHLTESGFTSRDNVRGFVAVSPSTGNVLDGTGSEFEAPAGSEPVRVARFIPHAELRGVPAVNSANEVISPEFSAVSVYGAPATVPTVTTEPASEVTGTKATLTGTVNPAGLPVSECFFEYGETVFGETVVYDHKEPCEGSIPTDSSPHPVHLNVSGLEPNGHTYHFRLIAFNANGQEETADRTFTTANTVVAEAAGPIGSTTATLNGTVRPEGSAYSECFFEYGLSSNTSFEGKANCAPSAAAIGADFSAHAVKAALTELQKNATYRFRLVATNNLGTLKSEEVTFATNGLPQVGEVRASDADQGSLALEAKINPSGSGTSYRFEWGTTSAYGNVTPAEFEPFIGSGTEPVQVKSRLSGLPAGTAYHYRLVASNGFGTTRSADQVAETLNSCGLAAGRCFELVSRPEAGPVAIPGESNAHIEMHYQAATAGSGALAYPVESGYPEASKGADVLYRATRGPDGWLSTQLSAPIIAPNERNEAASVSSGTQFLSNDLSCGFLESWQPLTADPSMRLQYEAGGSNLYRLNPDGSYTGVSYLAPENPGDETYSVAFASQDCSKVVFSTEYTYPGIPGAGRFRLYEWEEGTLRNAGVVPGPSGEVVVAASAGGRKNTPNTVSEDGSRVFFTAERRTSPNSEEIGKQAIFVRENGTVSRDLSQSETSTPDEGAEYQWATADGSKVFFTANAGLTDESNSEGTDLYEYDLETEELTDRSVAAAEGGAQVVGFVGAAKDGSRVYFASRNQLVPGRGNSRAQNLSANSYSIYGESGNQVDFAGTIKAGDLTTAVVADQTQRTATVSPDGRYLLFESAARVTGYENGGVIEAYLYDAQGGSQGTTCVSCRQDGQPSVAPVTGYSVLPRADYLNNTLHPPQFLTEKRGEARVFFSSPDVLAPGATEGQNNIYEWAHDQVFRLASALQGSQSPVPFAGGYATFGGASDNGSDVYIVTPETLTWEDGDERPSAYDARIGGGRPKPPAPPAGCSATVEGSCQGTAQGSPAIPGAASATFNGPGNATQAQAKKKKAHKKKAHKKKSKKHAKKKQKKGSGKKARHANGKGRTGK